jgi:hypothetical protein
VTEVYDPENFMLSTSRVLKDYVEAFINTGVFEVIMEFPGAVIDQGLLPLKKTVIHFELDDIDSKPVGLGDGMFADNYNATDETITPQYASVHKLLWDVGIWASDRSGGTTQRARARQMLEFLFGRNNGGIERLREFSDNDDGVLEITDFSGGRFLIDTSENDQKALYRMVNCQLEIRVFSRTPLSMASPIPTIEDHTQVPDITILG